MRNVSELAQLRTSIRVLGMEVPFSKYYAFISLTYKIQASQNRHHNFHSDVGIGE